MGIIYIQHDKALDLVTSTISPSIEEFIHVISRTWKMEEADVQDHSRLQSKFKASLRHMRSCLIHKQTNNSHNSDKLGVRLPGRQIGKGVMARYKVGGILRWRVSSSPS